MLSNGKKETAGSNTSVSISIYFIFHSIIFCLPFFLLLLLLLLKQGLDCLHLGGQLQDLWARLQWTKCTGQSVSTNWSWPSCKKKRQGLPRSRGTRGEQTRKKRITASSPLPWPPLQPQQPQPPPPLLL